MDNKRGRKKLKFDPERGLVFCPSCGVYFNYDIARENQYCYNKIRQEVRCPVCEDLYDKEN